MKFKITSALLMAITLGTITASCSQYTEENDQNNNISNVNSFSVRASLDTALGEKADPDEEAATNDIVTNILNGLRRDYKQPPVKRDVHTKTHGCVKAIFKVHNENLDPKYRVGVFSENKDYQSWIRFSNGQGHPKPDKAGDVRGMAIKLMGVPGKKVLENEADEQTQDFLLINNNTFFIETLRDYTKLIKATSEGEASILAFGITHPKVSYRLYNIFKKKITSPLENDYFSTVPF
jgi:catalase